MSIFFFDIETNGVLTRDNVGHEVKDREAARREAVLVIGDLARSLLPTAGDDHAITVTVRDEAGRMVCEVTGSLHVRWPDDDGAPNDIA